MIKQMFQWLWGLIAVVVENEIRSIKRKIRTEKQPKELAPQ